MAETLPSPGTDTTPPPVPLWRNVDYLLRLGGQTVSIMGTQVSQIAFPLLVLGLTHSPAQAGFMSAVRIIPYVVLGLLAGALVDRWDRKRTMILCDSARAVAMASVVAALATNHLSLVQLYLVSLIEGSLSVFFSLSMTASLPRIVRRDQLPAAMGQSDATYQLAGIFGPSLGGVLYGLGRSVPFLADAVSYAVSVLSLSFMRAEFQERRSYPPRRLWSEIAEGLVWLWRQPVVRTIGFLSTLTWIMLSAMQLLIIVLARQQGAGAGTIGLILAIGGVGGMIGSLTAGAIQRRLGFARVIIVCGWLWALIFPLFAVAPNVLALGIIGGGLLLVFPIYNVTQMSYRVALIPDHLQGRVNSAFRLIAFTGQPVGTALCGVLLQSAGTRITVLILAIAPFGLALGATFSRHIREAKPLAEIHPV